MSGGRFPSLVQIENSQTLPTTQFNVKQYVTRSWIKGDFIPGVGVGLSGIRKI